jgi:hypothetical protein
MGTQRVKAERLKARHEDILHRDNTGEVHGTAVDVDELFEQRAVCSAVRVDRRCHSSFRRRERCCGAGLTLGQSHGSHADREDHYRNCWDRNCCGGFEVLHPWAHARAAYWIPAVASPVTGCADKGLAIAFLGPYNGDRQ